METLKRTQVIIYAAAAVLAVASLVLLLTWGQDGAPWAAPGDEGAEAGSPATEAVVGRAGTLRSSSDQETDDPANPDAGTSGSGSDADPSSSGGSEDPTSLDPETLSRTAVAQLEIPGFDVPQTYEARVTVLGWRDQATGTVYVQVGDARLMGPIDPNTGVETGPPPASERDNSPRFEGLVVLATTGQGADTFLVSGRDAEVWLVLMPTIGGATFVVEREA